MPLTERMQRHLDFLESGNYRDLYIHGSTNGIFRGLTDDEFQDVSGHPFWAKIREFHLSDAPNVTRLPPLPRRLQLLALRNTAVREFPDLPPTLKELQLERNTHLKIPNEIPQRITHIVLKHNGIKEIPYLHHTTKFLIREPDLVEPFRTILEEYTKRKGAAAQMRPQTAESRQEVVDAQRDFYTNLHRAWLTKKANVRRRGRNVATLRRLEKGPLSALRAGIPEEIASFLSAKAAHNPLEEQLTSLREEHESLPRSARGGTRRARSRSRST